MRINIETDRLILRYLMSDDDRAAFLWRDDPDGSRLISQPDQ